jgi:uncharacterized protein (TIGR02466 family)
MKIHKIFPTAVATVENSNIPKDEHDTLLNAKYHVLPNYGTFHITENKYILNTVPNLYKWIKEQIDNYTEEVLSTSQKLKITQSWCIKHKNEPQKIFPHQHANSIISGSYYVDAQKDSQSLKVYRPEMVTRPYLDWSEDLGDKEWNWPFAEFPVTTGKLILFPSQLLHSVSGIYPKKEQRCVLAFNTWFDGSFGVEDQLTRVTV